MKEINELENTIAAINNLTEEDAKSLLKIVYGFVNTAMTGDGGDKVKLEIVNKLSDVYRRIPVLNDLRDDNISKKTTTKEKDQV